VAGRHFSEADTRRIWDEILIEQSIKRGSDPMLLKSLLRQFFKGEKTLRHTLREVPPLDRDFMAALLISSELSARYLSHDPFLVKLALFDFLKRPALVEWDHGPVEHVAEFTKTLQGNGHPVEERDVLLALLKRAQLEFLALRPAGGATLRWDPAHPRDPTDEQAAIFLGSTQVRRAA